MTIENLVLPGLLAACLFALSSPLQAQDRREGGHTQLALDLEYAGSIDQGDVTTGAGGAIRLGSQADWFLLSLTGEIGGSYHQFGGVPDVRVYRGFLGGRISVGKILEPGLYGHLGIGSLSVDPGDSRTAATFDAGLFLDLTVLPVVDLGIHAGYVTLLGTNDLDAFDYYVAGAHGALIF
jgi:hypothetical protein